MAEKCPVFISGVPSGSWMPSAILVDEENELLFVSDAENSQIHTFNLNGELESTVGTNGVLTAKKIPTREERI